MAKTSFIKPLLFFILFSIPLAANSQSNIELSGGFGVPEFFCIKMKFGINTQVALSQGFAPKRTERADAAGISAIELYYHFATRPTDRSRYTEQLPWYTMAGLAMMAPSLEDLDWMIYARIGRTLNMSEKKGINIDFGPVIMLTEGARDYYGLPVTPGGSITFFVRF